MEGINEPAVTNWIKSALPDFESPYNYELIAGGRSNLTFAVTGATGKKIVLRRPPVSHVLPTAHDMEREFRIISALKPVGFEVATPLAVCHDKEVNDYPFYLMSFVDGYILKEPELLLEKFPNPNDRKTISESVVDTLVKLHSFDIDEIGLGDLARKEGYIERQLKRWYSQFRSSASEIDHRVPEVDEMFTRLSATVPEQKRTAIVHGDYRLDNTAVGQDGKIAAVLDWEICTLGDPLADIGLLLVYWTEPSDNNPPLSSVTSLDGFYTRAEIAQRYANAAKVDLGLINYYVSFGYWKLACILEGVYSRYVQGARGGDRSEITDYAKQVMLLAQSSFAALEKF